MVAQKIPNGDDFLIKRASLLTCRLLCSTSFPSWGDPSLEHRNTTTHKSSWDRRLRSEFLIKNQKFVETSGAKTLNDGMLQHPFEGAVIFVSLQHFIAPAFDLMPCLPSRQRREAIGAFNPRREHSIAAFSYLPSCTTYQILANNSTPLPYSKKTRYSAN